MDVKIEESWKVRLNEEFEMKERNPVLTMKTGIPQ